MAKADATKTVLEAILEWSENRPKWQRDALRRIVTGGTPTAEDTAELVSLCRKGQGDSSVELNSEPLTAAHLPADPGTGESISIESLADVVGVNQLAPAQTLSFVSQGLNVVYGPNGSGKSGYARILKKACRARLAGEIMPDAFNPSPSGKATANITLAAGSAGSRTVNWEDNDRPDPTLSAVTVFDRECASVHLKQKNEVWFRPFGLDIPDDLAKVCQDVKEQLAEQKEHLEETRDPIFADPIWSETSTIGKFLNALGPKANAKEIFEPLSFSAADEKRLAQLNRDMGQDPQKAAEQQRQSATKIRGMLATLKALQERYSDGAIQTIWQQKDAAQEARSVANAAATKAFGDLDLDGVGTLIWKGLWEAARRYSESLEKTKQSFPPKGDEVCVLCHQTISPETAARMSGFEGFIQKDTEDQANAAEKRFRDALREFADARIDIRLISEARRLINQEDASLAKAVLSFIASARVRRWQVLDKEGADELAALLNLRQLARDQIEKIAERMEDYASELASAADGPDRAKLMRELDDLRDRSQASRLQAIGESEITRLRTLQMLDACILETSTTQITKLGNNLADTLITPKMRDRFAEEIGRLAAGRVRVEVVRSGGKFGSPQYEVKFFANAKAKVHQVLSEGEQTCVALASYLTELANASHQSSLVFDDPVSSLDHRWRRKVAERLVTEAQARQIIVFSHDLIFVNDLHDIASATGVPVKLGNLSRSNEGVGVFSDGLPWRASGVKDRIDKLEKAARDAKTLYENQDEDTYRSAAVRIYSELRATWERGLEDIVFAGVLQRHRDYINPKNLRKVTVLGDEDVDAFHAGYGKCCDFTEAHDPSRGRDEELPEPAEIMSDIQALADWQKDLRDKHKSVT